MCTWVETISLIIDVGKTGEICEKNKTKHETEPLSVERLGH